MAKLEDIIVSYKFHHPDGGMDLLNRAYEYAHKCHDGQKRRSGEPYIVHPMAVAKISADIGLCEHSICAALLHDVVEDTDTTTLQIAENFGEDVAMLVDGLTKLDNVHFNRREQRQAESFRKMLIATVKDIRVLLIKLADRLHNMSTLEAMPPEKQERIAQETRDVYTPLAGRLGLAWLKADLDDLAFKYLESSAYIALHEAVNKTRTQRVLYINKVKKQLDVLLREKGINNVKVSGRLKNLYSIFLKMNNKDLEYENVHDAIAFRVICDSVETCYAIIGFVHSNWVPVPGLIKDYIAMPKANHYQSLHTTVTGDGGQRMEIQIRTQEMHDTAEYGIAAHWAYKEGKKTSDSNKDVYVWLREILENQKGLDDSSEFFDSVKVDLLHEAVYVFTPRGDIKNFIAGATPLDFAYSVHTEVGTHCRGARINGALVPFDTVLKNGDSVEIITADDQRPTKAWLDIAKTSRARNKINVYLRAEQKKQSLILGRDLLEKAMRKEGLSFNKVIKSKKLEALAPKYKLSSVNEIIAAVGYGKLDENSVVYDLVPDESKKSAKDNLKESPFERLLRKVKWQDDGIIIDGVDNIMVNFAKCCNPLPGEQVIGYVSRGRGIIVHRQGCVQAANLEKERRIKVQWSSNAVSSRPVKIQIVSNDRPGILASLSNTFLEKNINISSVFSENRGPDGAFTTFVFPISNVSNLKALIKSLKQIKGVYNVIRLQN